MSNNNWDAEVNSKAYKRQLLDFLRNELLRYRPDIPDPQLQRAVTEWIVAVADVPTGTLHERLTDRLTNLETNHPMRRTPRMKNGQQAFPEDCRGCQFADEGSACPVIHDRVQKRKRSRIMSEATNAEELRTEMMDFAIGNDCQVLQEELQSMRKDYEPLLNIGQFLLLKVESDLSITDEVEAVKNALANVDAVGDRGVSSLSEALDRLARLQGDTDSDSDTDPLNAATNGHAEGGPTSG
jgi:hypothetical protein